MAFAVAALIGIVIEKVIVRRLYDRPLDSLLATWGVSLILQQAARSVFGAPNVAVKSPEWLIGGVTLFSVTFPYKRLFILALVFLRWRCSVSIYLKPLRGGGCRLLR